MHQEAHASDPSAKSTGVRHIPSTIRGPSEGLLPGAMLEGSAGRRCRGRAQGVPEKAVHGLRGQTHSRTTRHTQGLPRASRARNAL